MLKFKKGDRVRGLPFNESGTGSVFQWRRCMSEACGTIKTADNDRNSIFKYFVHFDNGYSFWCQEEWIEFAEPDANMNVTSEDLMEILK